MSRLGGLQRVNHEGTRAYVKNCIMFADTLNRSALSKSMIPSTLAPESKSIVEAALDMMQKHGYSATEVSSMFLGDEEGEALRDRDRSTGSATESSWPTFVHATGTYREALEISPREDATSPADRSGEESGEGALRAEDGGTGNRIKSL